MNEESVNGVLKILEEMLSWNAWETRHGGLLGLKYLFVVCDINKNGILNNAFQHIFKGMFNHLKSFEFFVIIGGL